MWLRNNRASSNIVAGRYSMEKRSVYPESVHNPNGCYELFPNATMVSPTSKIDRTNSSCNLFTSKKKTKIRRAMMLYRLSCSRLLCVFSRFCNEDKRKAVCVRMFLLSSIEHNVNMHYTSFIRVEHVPDSDSIVS